MFISYKTEIDPTPKQIHIIENYFKVCIEAYNRYLRENFERLEQNRRIIKPYSYLKCIKDGIIDDDISKYFVKKCYFYAVENVLRNAEKLFLSYLRSKGGQPRYKKKGTKYISIHFKASDFRREKIDCERHRIFIPYIGWIKIKEKGYIPYNDSGRKIVGGWIKKRAGRYYLSALVKEPERKFTVNNYSEGLGIDLNVNNFAVLSDGTVFENINKSERIERLNKKINREWKKNTRKMYAYKALSEEEQKNCEKKNFYKELGKIDVMYSKITNIRQNYLRQCVNTIVKKNPEFVAIEDLHVGQLVSDNRFSKYVSNQSFYQFKIELHRKCKEHGIEVRVVDKWFPSTKMCHECGYINRKLNFDERDYICPSCGVILNRDLNASLNLRDSDDYRVWK